MEEDFFLCFRPGKRGEKNPRCNNGQDMVPACCCDTEKQVNLLSPLAPTGRNQPCSSECPHLLPSLDLSVNRRVFLLLLSPQHPGSLQPNKSSVPLLPTQNHLFQAPSTPRHGINLGVFNFYKCLKESLSSDANRYSSSDRHPMNDIFLNPVPGSLGIKSETNLLEKKPGAAGSRTPLLGQKRILILPYRNLRINE